MFQLRPLINKFNLEQNRKNSVTSVIQTQIIGVEGKGADHYTTTTTHTIHRL